MALYSLWVSLMIFKSKLEVSDFHITGKSYTVKIKNRTEDRDLHNNRPVF